VIEFINYVSWLQTLQQML